MDPEEYRANRKSAKENAKKFDLKKTNRKNDMVRADANRRVSMDSNTSVSSSAKGRKKTRMFICSFIYFLILLMVLIAGVVCVYAFLNNAHIPIKNYDCAK